MVLVSINHNAFQCTTSFLYRLHPKFTMATVPGSVGLPLVSDKSYAFYKDPVKFVEQYFEYYRSRVFCARFLNTPTIFIGSNAVLQEVLQGGFLYLNTDVHYMYTGICRIPSPSQSV